MNPLSFVVLLLALSGAFLLAQAIHPWAIQSIATWAVRFWLLLAAATCVIGIVRA